MLLVFLIHLLFLTPVLGQLPAGVCLPTVLPGAAENTVSSSFSQAYAVKIEPVTGKLFVADASTAVSKVFRFASGAGLLSGQVPEATFGGAGTVSANTYASPYDITFTSSAQMYVADYGNGRVLGYTTTAMNIAGSGIAADKVIQQFDFVSTTSTFSPPITTAALDGSGNLWYADSNGGLRMTLATTLSSGSILPFCDLNLVSGIQLGGTYGCTATTIGNAPYTIQFDSSNNLYLADSSQNRIMVWRTAASKTAGSAADFVLGQASFTTCTATTSQTGLKNPQSCTYDVPSSTLMVGDTGNNRVMLFQNPASTNQAAVYQFGQTDYTSTASSVVSVLDLKYDRFGGTNSLYIVDGTTLKRYCPVSFSFSVTNTNSVTNTVTVTVTNSNTNSFTSSYTNSVTNSYTNSITHSVSKKVAGKTAKRSAAGTPVCGNGVAEGNEECDYGKQNGSGASCCSVFCKLYIYGTKCGRIPGPGCIRAPHCNLIGRCVSGVPKRDGTKCYKRKGKCLKGVCSTSR